MAQRLFKLDASLVRSPLAAEKRADAQRLGTSRCTRCGRAMCHGSASSPNLGRVCGQRLPDGSQRLLLFPKEGE